MTQPFFNSANAREMAAKAQESRRINKALLADSLSVPTIIEPDAKLPDTYVGLQLTRVRAQISRVNAKIDREDDPQQLERLARALNVLSERERVLAGRPTPGQLRPAKEPTKRTPKQAWAEPV